MLQLGASPDKSQTPERERGRERQREEEKESEEERDTMKRRDGEEVHRQKQRDERNCRSVRGAGVLVCTTVGWETVNECESH